MSELWRSQRSSYQESLNYLKGRQNGTITSFVLPWGSVNNATVGGIEWHSMVLIGGRPAAGKTLLKDQIIRESFRLNPKEDFRVLEFSLEMIGRNTAIRAYTSELGINYKQICSAEGTLSDANLSRCRDYALEAIKNPVDTVEKAPTVIEFQYIVEEYMKKFSKQVKRQVKQKNGNITEVPFTEYTKTVITVDHSILIKCGERQSRNEMLYEFGETLTALKRRYPIIFLILSQLNRDIERPERNEDGKYGNYILPSDIFGGDALLQHCDLALGINRPGKQKIRFYGAERYIIDDDRLLALHFLKSRNGDVGVTFFTAAFEKMQLIEREAPDQQATKHF